MMAKPPPTNGIHGMSLLVGELVAKVEHLSGHLKMNSEAAERQRSNMLDKIEAVRDDVHAVKSDVRRVDQKVDGVVQEVAEMRNEQALIRARWWEVTKGVSAAGWAAICAVGAGAYALYTQFR